MGNFQTSMCRQTYCVHPQGSFELIAQVAPKAVARILEGMARRMSAGVGASGQCALGRAMKRSLIVFVKLRTHAGCSS